MDYTDENYSNQNDEKIVTHTRPKQLSTLCILTFIGSGYYFLSYALMPFFIPIVSQQAGNYPFPQIADIYEQMMAVPTWNFLLLSFCSLVSLIGAIFMYKMRKIGFHVYVSAKLLNIFTSLFLVTTVLRSSILSVLFTVLIAIWYGVYYKEMMWKDEIINTPSDNFENNE